MEDRRKLADGKEIWVIKAGFPNTPVKVWWSEYAFSRSLKKYLERWGYFVIVESYDEWYDGEEADVVVVLRGHQEYFPDRKIKNCIYIMWNLSHPSTIMDAEYSAYDLVCISSPTHAAKIKERINVPVKILPMCADTEIFFPDTKYDREKEYEYDWIFVGNSRYVKRKSVVWSIAHNIPLKIWGANWEKVLPESAEYIVAENIPNDELPKLYRNAKVTVDDHYEDMVENGFINTRIVEALACGLPVISDYSEVLLNMFGDAVLCYRSEEEFVEQTRKIMEDYDVIKEKVNGLWPIIHEKYSFEACAGKLKLFSEEIKEWKESCKKTVDELKDFQEQKESMRLICQGDARTEIKVSVIVSVYNAEKYLNECMDSLTGQTLKEIEIICIDDGSCDSSLEILKGYAKKDGRITVYIQKNQGLSVVRNAGIEKARGRYVYFIDSDDFLGEEALEKLYEKMYENQLDIIFFDGITFFDTEEDRQKHSGFRDYYLRKGSYPEKCTGSEMLVKMRTQKEYRSSAVMQMFRHEFLDNSNLRFCPGILHEDNDFSFKAILMADSVGYLPNAYYNRRVHEDSIMTRKTGIAHVYGYFRVLFNMLSFVDSKRFNDDVQNAMYDVLQEVSYNLKKKFSELTWQEQSAFDHLDGGTKLAFKLFVQPEMDVFDEFQKIHREKEATNSVFQKMKKENEKINAKLQKTYAEKSEMNAKLQKTYAEKSEINRKLQITYGEKYDRGLEIKRLNKELEAIKSSETYRFARIVGYPIRCFRKLIKKLRQEHG